MRREYRTPLHAKSKSNYTHVYRAPCGGMSILVGSAVRFKDNGALRGIVFEFQDDGAVAGLNCLSKKLADSGCG